MAKGSFLGVKRGKLGDAVGYNVTNSNDKDKQGWRVYQPVVRNPQTDGQMVQRVKLAAVNNLYRDLKEIIRRSMENKKYGDESRRAWLSMALGQQFEGPWIPKGYMLGLPILGVPISVGSLQPVVTETKSASNSVDAYLPGDYSDLDDPTTIGGLSEYFVRAGYQNGDQVTFVYGWVPIRTAFSWSVESFIIDTTSSKELPVGWVFAPSTSGAGIFLNFSPSNPMDALAVIVSRDGQTAGSHLRSTAFFAMNATAAADWYSSGAYELAKRSYLNSDAANTNWEQDPSGEVLPVGTTRAMVNSATPAQVQVNAYRTQNGYLQVFDNTNSIWRYVYCVDVRMSQYHMWLTSDKLTGSMWSGTAPTGAVATDAIRMQSGNDATAVDLEFDEWLVSDAGYSARFIYGNIPS